MASDKIRRFKQTLRKSYPTGEKKQEIEVGKKREPLTEPNKSKKRKVINDSCFRNSQKTGLEAKPDSVLKGPLYNSSKSSRFISNSRKNSYPLDFGSSLERPYNPYELSPSRSCQQIVPKDTQLFTEKKTDKQSGEEEKALLELYDDTELSLDLAKLQARQNEKLTLLSGELEKARCSTVL